MTHFTRTMILTLGLTVFFSGTNSRAEDYDKYGVNFNLRQDDLDAYWHETATWAFYGYRPKMTAQPARFMPLMPTYGSANSSAGYSFGSVMTPAQIDPSMYTPSLRKTTIPMTKYGTWH